MRKGYKNIIHELWVNFGLLAMTILDVWKIYIQTTKRTNTLTDPSSIVGEKKKKNILRKKKKELSRMREV